MGLIFFWGGDVQKVKRLIPLRNVTIFFCFEVFGRLKNP